MIFHKPFAVCVLLALFVSKVEAQQLTTFVDGQPAIAAQVNGNFQSLLNEINTLKTQVTALQSSLANVNLQMLASDVATLKSQVAALQANQGSGNAGTASIVGTWDLYTMDSPYFFNSGTSMDIHASAGAAGTIVFRADGTYTATDSGSQSILTIAKSIPPNSNAIQFGTSTIPSNTQETGTWTVAGHTVTTTSADGSGSAVFSGDGSVLLSRSSDGRSTTVSIGIKR